MRAHNTGSAAESRSAVERRAARAATASGAYRSRTTASPRSPASALAPQAREPLRERRGVSGRVAALLGHGLA